MEIFSSVVVQHLLLPIHKAIRYIFIECLLSEPRAILGTDATPSWTSWLRSLPSRSVLEEDDNCFLTKSKILYRGR